ncbi:hypothetical protein [Microbacterium excoecariae]|uniref:hypothetical protein n=1 Tax=Microbacterium excoecariae TaxID=2715210 RepID=UPI00140DF58A|nr:hypothetical protein [Microbacterium excoecariae]NHI16780.1 hypothetical protein [Microbacterium excoecariae]
MDLTLLTQIVFAVATLLASLGGYLLAGLNERRRDERIQRREGESRRFERAAQLEDESHAFQRETLLSLQDALQKMARLTGKAMHFDHMQARKGKYTQLPDGLSAEMLAADVEVSRLTSRLLDPQVRAAVKGLTDLSAQLSTLPADLQGLIGEDLERHATARLREFGDRYNAVVEVVGEAVRSEIDWRPS